MGEVLFENWFGVLRVVIVGGLAFTGLILALRISGKRTLSKWNAFDFVVTIALGSTLATVLLSKDVRLAEGLTAFALLIALQFVITWIAVRSRKADRIIKSSPTLLLKRGAFIDDKMLATRVTESEVLAAVRASGSASLEDIEAVVLETDGSFSVVRSEKGHAPVALKDVDGYSE
ncbi:MAG: DUF421 domain-containing protein [Blastocatellia bacterium]|nr:DUF421 domain-containing protein [Blastocatellia bacterium]